VVILKVVIFNGALDNLMTSMSTKSMKKMAEQKGEKIDARPYLEE